MHRRALTVNYVRTMLAVLIPGLGCLAGCDEDWALQLAFGTMYPDARIEVTLDAPASKGPLFLRFKEAAETGGFFDLRSRAITPKDIRENNVPRTFTWFPDNNSDYSDYRIAFMSPRGVERPSSFIFVFYNNRTETFTAQEWRMFFKWKEEYLPKVFPEATLRVTHHPAEFTKHDDIARISAITGIPVPERYKKKAAHSS